MGTCFSKSALDFLLSLKRNNDRAWFAEHKPVYERELRDPMLAFISELNEAMLAFAPQHVHPPQKAMMRIYRDIRFSKDKRPYKTYLSAWWARDGMSKTSGAGFYFELSGTEVRVAAGIFMPDRDQLRAIRTLLAERYEEMGRLMAPKRWRGKMSQIEESPMIRTPKGFGELPQAALEMIRGRRWGVISTLPVTRALSPTLGREVLTRFRLAVPLLEFLNGPLMPKPRRPLF